MATKNPGRLRRFLSRQYERTLRWIPAIDRWILEARYLAKFGRSLDLANPKTFNEKILWINLYYRQPMMTKLADKYLVKEYVREKIGGQYLRDELGVYDTVDEFQKDLPRLPKRFVIRATHGCKWNSFIEDKSQITEEDLALLRDRLSRNYYDKLREWAYKDIKPRLLCERFIEPVDASLGIAEYAYHCFHGEPKIANAYNRQARHDSFFDLAWNKLPVKYRGSPLVPIDSPKPATHEQMIELSRALSEGWPYVRIDLFSEKKVIFGEMTFYPMAGLSPFDPDEYDAKFGDLLDLSKIPESQINRR